MEKMSKYKKKFPDVRIEPRTLRVPGGPLNPFNRRAIVVTTQNYRVCLQQRTSPNFRKLINRKQRPTREKAETRVKYFLLIHLRKISELKVECNTCRGPLVSSQQWLRYKIPWKIQEFVTQNYLKEVEWIFRRDFF